MENQLGRRSGVVVQPGGRLRAEDQPGRSLVRREDATLRTASILGLLIALVGQGCGRSPMDGNLARARAGTSETGGSARGGQGIGGSGGNGGATAASGSGGISAGGAAGASTATGGVNGQGGIGSARDGGAAGGSGDCPPCLAAALAACIPSGACIVEGHGSGVGNIVIACYANGVEQSVSFGADGNSITTRAVVSNKGKICLATEKKTEAWVTGTVTVTNGAGEELAKGIVDARMVTVSCDGMSYPVDDACLGMADTTGCSPGTCP